MACRPCCSTRPPSPPWRPTCSCRSSTRCTRRRCAPYTPSPGVFPVRLRAVGCLPTYDTGLQSKEVLLAGAVGQWQKHCTESGIWAALCCSSGMTLAWPGNGEQGSQQAPCSPTRNTLKSLYAVWMKVWRVCSAIYHMIKIASNKGICRHVSAAERGDDGESGPAKPGSERHLRAHAFNFLLMGGAENNGDGIRPCQFRL